MQAVTTTIESVRSELSRYTFRRMGMGELRLVNDLFNRCHHTNRAMPEAEWLYKDHPYGEAIILGAFAPDEELVGVLPAMAHTFLWNGREEAGYQLIDAVTAPAHRGRGLFGHLVELICAMVAEKHFAVFAFPNEQSLSVYQKTGVLETICDWGTRARVLVWPAYVQYKLGRGGRGSATSDGASLSDGEISLVPVHRFESDFEDIQAAVGKGVTSLTLRRKEFLNWRYFGFAPRHYAAALIGRGDRTEGYAVVRMIDGIAHVMDLLVTPDGRTARKAVRLVTRWAKHMGAIAIYFSASGDKFMRRALYGNGFLLKRRGGTIVLDPRSVRRLTSVQQRPLEADDFYFVMGDGDFH